MAGLLLFVPLGLFEMVAKVTSDILYRAGAGVALAATVLIVWVSGAVGITDSAADLLFVLAPMVGLSGALVTRFRPAGMVRAMLATALTLVLAGTVTLMAGMAPATTSTFEVLGASVFFAMPFAGAALLFRQSARAEAQRGAA